MKFANAFTSQLPKPVFPTRCFVWQHKNGMYLASIVDGKTGETVASRTCETPAEFQRFALDHRIAKENLLLR